MTATPWINPAPTFGPVPTIPARAPFRELEAQLDTLRSEARAAAEAIRSSTALTKEGRTGWHSSTGLDRKWGHRLETLTRRMSDALDATEDRAAALRADMTSPAGTVEERTLAELRFARRADAIRSSIEATPAAAADLIRDADPLDVPILIEAVRDVLGTDGPLADAGQHAAERGLRDRSPEYAAAAVLATKATTARHVLTAKVSDAAEAVSDLNSRPTLGSLADKSVAVVAEELAELEG